jgi:hypothetical protein
MALLPDKSGLVAGTSITWDTVPTTYTLTLTSLTNNSGREGGKNNSGTGWLDSNFGSVLPEFVEIRFESAPGSAVTAPNQDLELWIAESDSSTAGTNNPGGLTGADASVSTPDEKKAQCVFAMALSFSNALGTAVQRQYGYFVPTQAYAIPFVVNKSGQTLSGTAGNHKIVMTPYYRELVD